jgi:hypothetical protein
MAVAGGTSLSICPSFCICALSPGSNRHLSRTTIRNRMNMSGISIVGSNLAYFNIATQISMLMPR